MLSYQHIYHAGCAADVHKHAILAAVLAAMVREAGAEALLYAETHSGRGHYDLAAPEALKTGEAAQGVARLAGTELPEAMRPYLAALAQKQGNRGRKNAYPGSPLIAARLLRPQDRLALAELHPREYQALADLFAGDKRAQPLKQDGYEAVRAALAGAKGARAFVFIDPSYEIKEEYAQAAQFAAGIYEEFPRATVLLWYPLLPAGRHERMQEAIPGETWHQEIRFAAPGQVRGMYGSGIYGFGLPGGQVPALEEIGAAVERACRFI
jgi:23S rRNA (adenine2030-N6)-methyltransferase